MNKAKLFIIVFALFCFANISSAQVVTNAQPVATEDYGTVYTNSFGGTVEVVDDSGSILTYAFHFAGIVFGSNWSLTKAKLTSLKNSEDVYGNSYSTIIAITYFTAGSNYINEPSITTFVVTDYAEGGSTIGLQVYDYFNPTELLYTSGTNNEGGIQQLNVNTGEIVIYAPQLMLPSAEGIY